MEKLIENINTVSIASIDEDGNPTCSYAPYFMKEDKVYIYISQVAEHHSNIMANQNVGIMMIQDESECSSLFARLRVTFKGIGKKIDNVPSEVSDYFKKTHGERLMDTIDGLDFDYFEIHLVKGRLVQGFGRAYNLNYKNGKWEQEHVVIDKKSGPHTAQ